MPDETFLEAAISEEGLRQRFLDDLIQTNIPGCSGIYYDPAGKLVNDFVYRLAIQIGFDKDRAKSQVAGMRGLAQGEPYALVPSVLPLIGCVTSMPIFVAKDAFSGKLSAPEIHHCVSAHEGAHVRQMTQGYPYFATEMYRKSLKKGEIRPIVHRLIDEVHAHHQGLLRIGEFSVSVNWRDRVIHQFKTGIAGLYNAYIDSKSQDEKGFIEAVLDGVPHSPRLISTGQIKNYSKFTKI